MDDFTMSNPVFHAYAIAAALMVLKVIGQGWITVLVMMRDHAGWASPEDLRPGPLNPSPDPSQLEPHPGVERSRRMHRNDLENIPAFWAAGLLFVAAAPPLWLAQITFYGFAAARLAHGLAYGTGQSHEMRATFYTIGTLLTAYMVGHVLVVAIF
jgi:uncharacterized MAPEG superfamily protein